MDQFLKVYTDGGSRGNPGPSASGFVVISRGNIIKKGSSFIGIGTNNQAEYKAVIIALEWLSNNLNIIKQSIDFFLDSELVTNQLSGKYKIKDKTLQSMAIRVKNLEKLLPVQVRYNAVRRENNQLADRLVNDELDSQIR